MVKLTINIDNETIKEIESCYGKVGKETVRNAVEDILDRYLNVEHFDPELSIENNNS